MNKIIKHLAVPLIIIGVVIVVSLLVNRGIVSPVKNKDLETGILQRMYDDKPVCYVNSTTGGFEYCK